MTTKDKRTLAESYFLNAQMSQQEIAARVGVSENTLSAWKKEGNWDVKKGAKTATRTEIITSYYEQLNLIKQSAVNEAGRARVMTAAETQQISIISKAIERLDKRLAIDQYIQVMEEFTNHLFATSREEARRLIPVLDNFIQAKFA
jgi:DNA-binding XRE family transcriptional regulator